MRRGLLLAVCLALAGCDFGGESKPTTTQKLPPGPTVRLALSAEPRTLDPALAADLPSVNVVRQLFAGLTRIEGKRAVPDLARSWKLSEGGRVWTFFLRDGIGWSDGRPITAGDFRKAWLRALAPEAHSAYARAEMMNIAGAQAYRGGSGKAEDVGIETVDERTLRVTLRHPVPWLDEQVAYPVFFPVPSRVRGVSNGPFRLEDWRRGARLVLRRNARYWNAGSVGPSRVVFSILPAGEARSRLAAGRLEGLLPAGVLAPGFPWIDAARLDPARVRADRRCHALPTLSVQYLWFATTHPPLDDVQVRRALSLAIDRARIVRRALRGQGEALTTVAPPALGGPVNRGQGGRRPSFSKSRRALALTFTTQDPRAPAVAAAIAADLARLHVRVRLAPVPTRAALLARVGPPVRPGVDLALLGWSGEFLDAYNFLDQFPCASGLNVAGWCDRSFDALMAKAVRTLDDGARRRLERRLEAKLTGADGAFPAAPLYTVTDRVLLQRGLTGFGYSPLGFWDLRGLHFK